MAITNKRPPRKESVGAQYVCFNTQNETGEWCAEYETDVERTATVKSVKVTENAESADVYASGDVYDTDNTAAATNIEVEVVAIPIDTLAKMRGETVDNGGLFLSGGSGVRPFFAYGKVVKLKNRKERWEWFPKCKLAENSDEIATREEKSSEQNDTITINAYSFDAEGNKRAYVDSSAANFPSGLTEEKFFAKPILTKEELATAASGGA